jgi:hypothetical protein
VVKTAVTIVIKNCVRGSAAWFHELRHKQQEERWGLVSLTGSLQHYLLVAAFVCCLIAFWKLVFFLVFCLLINDYALEWDAELYSIRRVGLRVWLNRSWL